MKPIFVVLVAIVVGIAGFFGGMKYSQNQRQNLRVNPGQQMQGGQGRQLFGQGRQNGRPVTGEIVSTDDNSLTVKMPDGQSKIVILSASTQINKASEGSKSDLSTGKQIAVFGTENSDGSVTAVNIQLNPMFGRTQTITPDQSP